MDFWDQNQDGEIDHSEILAPLDTNNDGKLDWNEQWGYYSDISEFVRMTFPIVSMIIHAKEIPKYTEESDIFIPLSFLLLFSFSLFLFLLLQNSSSNQQEFFFFFFLYFQKTNSILEIRQSR